MLYDSRGDLAEALAHWMQALAIAPSHVPALNRVARLRATAPDASLRDAVQAVELAERAERVTNGRDPFSLDTLAAAYAEAGRFDDALRSERRAMELAAGRGDAAGFERRLALYAAHQPLREAR